LLSGNDENILTMKISWSMLFEINFEARGTDDPACPQEVN